jgi:hypothetical protein
MQLCQKIYQQQFACPGHNVFFISEEKSDSHPSTFLFVFSSIYESKNEMMTRKEPGEYFAVLT